MVSFVHWFRRFKASVPATPDTAWPRKPLVDSDQVLVSATHVWLRTIPNHLQPKQLCRHFPRVANLLAANWSDAVLTDRLLIDLMADRRGHRTGFPQRIVAELEVLLRWHLRRTKKKPASPARTWRGKRPFPF